MVSGMEEAYFTDLARLVLERQVNARELGLGWTGNIGALYFRVPKGVRGYPKMSKSIPASSIHLQHVAPRSGRAGDARRSDEQPALLSAIELASGGTPPPPLPPARRSRTGTPSQARGTRSSPVLCDLQPVRHAVEAVRLVKPAVVLLGASGRLGRQLIPLLSAAGIDTIAVARSPRHRQAERR